MNHIAHFYSKGTKRAQSLVSPLVNHHMTSYSSLLASCKKIANFCENVKETNSFLHLDLPVYPYKDCFQKLGCVTFSPLLCDTFMQNMTTINAMMLSWFITHFSSCLYVKKQISNLIFCLE